MPTTYIFLNIVSALNDNIVLLQNVLKGERPRYDEVRLPSIVSGKVDWSDPMTEVKYATGRLGGVRVAFFLTGY